MIISRSNALNITFHMIQLQVSEIQSRCVRIVFFIAIYVFFWCHVRNEMMLYCRSEMFIRSRECYLGVCLINIKATLWWVHNQFVTPVHILFFNYALLWRHNGCDGVSNHQPHGCLLNHLFRPRSKKSSKIRDTGLCARNSTETGEFPAQMASNAENVSIWWRHHGIWIICSKQ